LEKKDFVIVGSGPAAISAANTAAKLGVEALVIGEDPQIGGQIYRQIISPLKFRESLLDTQNKDIFKSLEDRFAEEKIQFQNKKLAWGIFGEDKIISIDNSDRPLIKAEKLLIAEGAYEAPVAFPGWTLPGIMTVGAVQILLKSQGIMPQGKIILAGTGPLIYFTASQLIKNGAEVILILESSSQTQWLRWATKLSREPRLLGSGFKYMSIIKKQRIPIYFSSIIIEARGNDSLEEVVFARVDNQWKPINGTEQRAQVDILALNFGFIPSTEFTHIAGCKHICDPYLRGWIPQFNNKYETSQEGIFVAGDCTGIWGVKAAVIEGEIVGLEVARQLGCISNTNADIGQAKLQKVLSKHRWYKELLRKIYAFRPGLLDLLTNETIVCRCEEVNFKAISERIERGSLHLEQIKRLSRAGMGRCQGRLCYPTLLGILSRKLSLDKLNKEDFSARPPVKPIPLRELFDMSISAGSESNLLGNDD